MVKICQSMVLVGCILTLVGCVSNQNVKGSYPAVPPRFTEGGAVGAVSGAAIGGVVTQTTTVAGGALAGGILGAAIGSYYDSEGLIKSLQNQGVTVVLLGDIVELVIPSDLVFDGAETEVKVESHPMMTQVVSLIQQYGRVNMSVEVSTDTVGTTAYQLEFSRLQAQSVTTFLWAHGVNLQRIDFQGLGSEEDVADPTTVTGSGFNRRIEITFWRQGHPSPYNVFFADKSENCWSLDDPDECNKGATPFGFGKPL